MVQMVNNINLNDKEISGKKGKERTLPSEPKEEAEKSEEEGFEVTKVVEPEVVRKSGLLLKAVSDGCSTVADISVCNTNKIH